MDKHKMWLLWLKRQDYMHEGSHCLHCKPSYKCNLFIYHQTLVVKERLQTKKHFIIPFWTYPSTFFHVNLMTYCLNLFGNLAKLIINFAVSRQWVPKILLNWKLMLTPKGHALMALCTAILKRNTSKKYDEHVKCGWTFWTVVCIFVQMVMTHAPKALI